ncbi:hypothetical protein F511_27528 [Dorcoceras hygrometricum]|uniref:Uncharacterized protein n=1 Tax=Dorcoceras hygrometricum TaxID=472368 RepID=A0A2Z7D6G8_9LAMI|nr:hypothetical protein F511_27528 [Dorcoceras hygrometricum]
MRRVINYHSSWARQRQVELFDALILGAVLEFFSSLVGRLVSYLAGDLRLAPTGITRRPALHGRRLYIRQSGPRPEGRLLRHLALEGLTRSARTDSPRKTDRSKSNHRRQAAADGGRCGGGGGRVWEKRERRPRV